MFVKSLARRHNVSATVHTIQSTTATEMNSTKRNLHSSTTLTTHKQQSDQQKQAIDLYDDKPWSWEKEREYQRTHKPWSWGQEYEYQMRRKPWLKAVALGATGLGLFGVYKYLSREEELGYPRNINLKKERIELLQSIEFMDIYEKELKNTLSSMSLQLSPIHWKKYDDTSRKAYNIHNSILISDQEKAKRQADLRAELKKFEMHTVALKQLLNDMDYSQDSYLTHRKKIIELLTLGADPYLLASSCYPLPWAVKNNDHELIELLVQSGGSLDSYSYHLLRKAETPLMAYHLIRAGVDIERQKLWDLMRNTQAPSLIPFYQALNKLDIEKDIKYNPWEALQYFCRDYTDEEMLVAKAHELHKAYPELDFPHVKLSEKDQKCAPCVKLAELMEGFANDKQATSVLKIVT